MTNCKDELARALIAPSFAAAPAGTIIDLAALFPANAAITFNEISVFNDADKPVKVAWTNDETGNTDWIIVPEGGKGYTHKLGKGHIATTSMKGYSTDGSVATGNITINLSRS